MDEEYVFIHIYTFVFKQIDVYRSQLLRARLRGSWFAPNSIGA